jgi:hypothetical protein
MTLRPEYSLIHSEFNDFLFAVVGEDESGMQLTVLSALTRLGFDPWREAARLSELTKGAAINALAVTISALPEADLKGSNSRSIAVDLVNRLPARTSPSDKSPQAKGIENPKPGSEAQKRLVWIMLAIAVVVALSSLFGG